MEFMVSEAKTRLNSSIIAVSRLIVYVGQKRVEDEALHDGSSYQIYRRNLDHQGSGDVPILLPIGRDEN